jgi:hypothetical protein
MLKKNSSFKSELGVQCDCRYMEEMGDLLRGVVHTIDDIIVSAAVLWNALFLIHMIHSMNIHASNIEACHKAADAVGSHVFRLDIDHSRVQCHIQNILYICRYNLSRMCTDGPPSLHRNRDGRNVFKLQSQRIRGLDAAGSTDKLIPRSMSPTFPVSRQSSVRLVKPDRVFPLLNTQLKQMNRLSRKLTSRDLTGLHEVVSDILEPNPKPDVNTIPKKQQLYLKRSNSVDRNLERSKPVSPTSPAFDRSRSS